MTKSAAFLLLMFSIQSFAQKAVPASRRYKEPTPIQMVFGSFTKPTTYYNNASAYTAVPDGQIEPSSLNLDTNVFPSSTGLVSYKPSFATGTGSIGVSGGTASLSTTGNQGILVTDTASAYAIAFPQLFVSCKISSNGAGSSADAVGCGIAKDGSNFLIAHWNRTGTAHTNVTIDVAGSVSNLATFNISVPTAPWYFGLSLVGNHASTWYSTNGTTWNFLATADVTSQKDFTVTGALANWYFCMEADLASGSSTWAFQSLKGGAFGGVGIRDTRFVTYPDGRPYMQGSVVYMLADVAGVVGSAASDTSELIFTYDLTGHTLTPIGVLFTIRGSSTVNDQAGTIVYDSVNNIERLTNDIQGGASRYTSQAIATDNWLASGYHSAPASAAMTLPYDNTSNWDANLACTSWNYSAATCSLWQLAYSGPTGSSHTHIATSTSDPSANSWSGVLNDTGISAYEGTTIIRSATGSTGVAYTTCISGLGTNTKCYNQAGSSLGALNATPPTSSANPAWPSIVCYASTCYFVTFDAGLFSTTAESMGNFSVATASRY